MKIKQDLPQFSKEVGLLVVSGRQSGKIYQASGGNLEEIENLRVPERRYSDNEGWFLARSRGGGMLGSGSVRKDTEERETKKFIKRFVRHLKKHSREADALYLFAPDFLKKTILSKLSHKHSQKIKYTNKGNYLKEHPFKLLELIKDDLESKKVEPIDEEARKILNK